MGRTPAHDGFECRLMRAENAEKTTGWLENGISAGSDDILDTLQGVGEHRVPELTSLALVLKHVVFRQVECDLLAFRQTDRTRPG